MTHSITIRLSQAAQQAALLAGQPAMAEQVYESGEPAFAAALIALGAEVNDSGEVHAKAGRLIDYAYHRSWYVSGCVDTGLAVRPADALAAVAAVAARVTEAIAARTAKEQAEIAARAAEEAQSRQQAAEWAALPVAWRASAGGICTCVPWQSEVGYRGQLHTSGTHRYEMNDLRRYAPAAVQEAQDEVDRLVAEKEARSRAERAAEIAEMSAWAAEHGSERLVACLDEGIECGAIYRDERARVSVPEGFAWRWERGYDTREPRNPPEDALELLSMVRLQLAEIEGGDAAAAELVFLPNSRAYAVRIDPGDWADDHLLLGDFEDED